MNIQELQPQQIVRVYRRGLTAAGYEDAIVTHVDYAHDEIEVALSGDRVDVVPSADVEVPR